MPLLLLVLGAGCAAPARPLLVPPEPGIVWPPAPDQARVRYLGEIRSSADFHPEKTFGQTWDELIHGPRPPSPLIAPHAVAVHADGERVAVADTGAMCVHLFNLRTQAYERREQGGSPARRFESPVAVLWVGEVLWVADSRLHAIAVLGTGGREQWIGTDDLKRPAGLAYCAANELCYVSDAGAHAVLAFDREGKVALQYGGHGAGPAQFNCPTHLACAPDGTLFVVDSLNFRVQHFSIDGTHLGTFGSKGDAAGDLALPKGIALGPDGNAWVVDAHFENLQAFTPEGQLLMALGREGHGPGEFWLPAGVCIDARRRMWVADTHNARVQVFELLQ